MRPNADSRKRKDFSAKLKKEFREIIVGNGRSGEPYIIAFHYASGNIASRELGTLFGFFEVEIHDQDAAYIVNFLASVAKKEYFTNPRRAAAQSFEAALHKINVALSEIAKNGNVSWLGHLHGAIGAVSEEMLYFSVTGEGVFYLARNGTFQSISTGLAETANEPHPLKTFVEISSGILYADDLVFTFSPSVWSLFSPEDLQRSLVRLGPQSFEQFLRTALINELPLAAVTLLTCTHSPETESLPVPSPKNKERNLSLENMWSQQVFQDALEKKVDTSTAKEETRGTPSPSPSPSGYTDKKTGHIYVQGESHDSFPEEENAFRRSWAFFLFAWQDHTRRIRILLIRNSRRFGKSLVFSLQGAWSYLGNTSRTLRNHAHNFRRGTNERLQTLLETKRAEREAERLVQHIHIEEPTETVKSPLLTQKTAQQYEKKLSQALIHIPSVIAQVSRSIQPRLTGIQQGTFSFLQNLIKTLRAKWQRWTLKTRLLIVGGMFLTILGGIFVFQSRTSTLPKSVTPTTEESLATPPISLLPPAEEPLSVLLKNETTLTSVETGSTLALTTINGTPYLVSRDHITNLRTQESTPTPTPLRLATGMDDLDALFVLTTSDTLFQYSVNNKTFEANALPLENPATIDVLESYLTYLYAYDKESGTITRFPRVESGFGTGTTWSKETMPKVPNPYFAVYENVVLPDPNGAPTLYSRGKKTDTQLTGPIKPVQGVAADFNHGNGDLYVLDHAEKRIVHWSAEGKLLAQYFHPSFSDIETFTVGSDGKTLLTVKNGTVSSWILP